MIKAIIKVSISFLMPKIFFVELFMAFIGGLHISFIYSHFNDLTKTHYFHLIINHIDCYVYHGLVILIRLCL